VKLVLVFLHTSHISIADQNFGTNRLLRLFPMSVHQWSVHKRVYSMKSVVP